jgi:hypothetical protein
VHRSDFPFVFLSATATFLEYDKLVDVKIVLNGLLASILVIDENMIISVYYR